MISIKDKVQSIIHTAKKAREGTSKKAILRYLEEIDSINNS